MMMFRTKRIEREIQHHLNWMNHHLMLLERAIARNDVYEVDAQTEKLEAIRAVLVEYEYFLPFVNN